MSSNNWFRSIEFSIHHITNTNVSYFTVLLFCRGFVMWSCVWTICHVILILASIMHIVIPQRIIPFKVSSFQRRSSESRWRLEIRILVIQNFSGGDRSLAVEVGIPVAWNLSSRFHNYFGIWISDFDNQPNVRSEWHPKICCRDRDNKSVRTVIVIVTVWGNPERLLWDFSCINSH